MSFSSHLTSLSNKTDQGSQSDEGTEEAFSLKRDLELWDTLMRFGLPDSTLDKLMESSDQNRDWFKDRFNQVVISLRSHHTII